ncbi:hypothetical protein [Polymorphospora rubra]|nr:hypothetical protein [Polymorphospora rubra]
MVEPGNSSRARADPAGTNDSGTSWSRAASQPRAVRQTGQYAS